ncbi:hypothetical protein D6D01_07521 [Aureobasidium pullulans]|uniref:BZIP domain-containing protein n=1 Tax=Aureobasidium pullulans TaxID=5580 RepID=A0A4S9KNX4_AURPU|nr:hypothetical protein D6D01_07521 [Aureobasidium pullulans]
MSSPSGTKTKDVLKQEDTSSQDKAPSPSRQDTQQNIPAIDIKPSGDNAKENTSSTNAPLAPPPVPNKANGDNDYFSGAHSAAHLTKEPNPFESAFGGSTDTPGKPQLPGVNSLTSPAPLLPGTTPAWPGSLRSGPLSPAMLTGPAGSSNDYFSNDHHFGGSFPTPNESSLRTGLTPGGGGSMFPQPSPNSQAIFNAIQSGGATPGTLDFHRTAMQARASQGGVNGQFAMPQPPTSAAADPNIQPNLDSKGFGQQQQNDTFEQHDANDAANGLFMLAQARGGNRNQPQQYPPPQSQPQMNYMGNPPHLPGGLGQQGHDGPANMAARANKNSIGSNLSGSTQNEHGNFSDSDGEDVKPSRGKGKKNGNNKNSNNGRRKAEDQPKGSNKRQKTSMPSMDEDESDMDDMDMERGPDNKKMTDEEKRKNFLERNRIAALKCRQRKKQWLANLQQKVEIFSTENDALAATVTQLREEIVGLKTLLLAHKECPVSQAQGISGMAMQNIAGDPHQFANHYGMQMSHMQQGVPSQANMQRR